MQRSRSLFAFRFRHHKKSRKLQWKPQKTLTLNVAFLTSLRFSEQKSIRKYLYSLVGNYGYLFGVYNAFVKYFWCSTQGVHHPFVGFKISAKTPWDNDDEWKPSTRTRQGQIARRTELLFLIVACPNMVSVVSVVNGKNYARLGTQNTF
jgi:hypothetical protein